jgi:hypothetical protein
MSRFLVEDRSYVIDIGIDIGRFENGKLVEVYQTALFFSLGRFRVRPPIRKLLATVAKMTRLNRLR